MTEAAPRPMRRRVLGIPLLTASVIVAVVVADQLTKQWAVAALSGEPPRHVVWTLQWNLSYNTGMAFSQGRGIGPIIGVFALVVVLALGWMVRSADHWVAAVSAGLIIGGAIGNLIDRLFRADAWLRGGVVDFIDLQWFPIFNIADSAITVGGIIFVLWSLGQSSTAGR
jgi:signal peptidase II